tara:strand:+ start:59165 stop:59944 length:780 start_codon:yes stop_codon:yes gene_type:complete
MSTDTVSKTETDLFWSARPTKEKDPQKVNISDLVQRDLETEFIISHLKATDSVLEVGCGNGFLTSLLRDKVKYIDAFDYAENMVSQAKTIYGEKNNTFFHDNIVKPQYLKKQYDVVICVRVLINLENFEQQKKAFANLLSQVKPRGKLLLLEGFIEGFDNLNRIRKDAHIDEMQPAHINYYSKKEDFTKLFENNVSIEETFHTGTFDFLTRVVYPALVGSENATTPGDFHTKIKGISKAYKSNDMMPLARLHGWSLIKN